MRYLFVALLAWSCAVLAEPSAPVTVYTAKKIITMNPQQPEATAVAVSNGRIVSVGSLASLKGILDSDSTTLNNTLADKILMPGFIDPHVHPALPAITTQFPYIAPEHWSLPSGEFPAATTPAAYKKRLQEEQAKHTDPKVPFITWGYHPLWHGEIYRQQLNEWFGDQPVMLWHRSFHEIIGNDAAFKLLGVTENDANKTHEANWERGHFWENGAHKLLPHLKFLFKPKRLGRGMRHFYQMLHRAGVTTALDMGTGLFGKPKKEIRLMHVVAKRGDVPTRVILTPIITDFLARGKTPAQALAEIRSWQKSNNERVSVGNHFKLMLDGAIFSGLAQMGPPGYLDGHEGIWMAPLDLTRQWAEFFWREGFQLHAHANGDKSAAALIALIRHLQKLYPRDDHRTVLEHFAYSTPEQTQQLKAVGAMVSANPYYHTILSDQYAKNWLGKERASNMVRLGSLAQENVTFALHSDCPMAPLSPLTLASSAVNRVTVNGNVTGKDQRLTVDQALRAITIDAARVIGKDSEIGSIAPGKRADFTVIESNPYTVDPLKLGDIAIWGTVFGGALAPIKQ